MIFNIIGCLIGFIVFIIALLYMVFNKRIQANIIINMCIGLSCFIISFIGLYWR